MRKETRFSGIVPLTQTDSKDTTLGEGQITNRFMCKSVAPGLSLGLMTRMLAVQGHTDLSASTAAFDCWPGFE